MPFCNPNTFIEPGLGLIPLGGTHLPLTISFRVRLAMLDLEAGKLRRVVQDI